MRLVTLNIMGGILYKPLKNFLQEYSPATDIFCFQEIFHTNSARKVSNKARVNILKEIVQTLPGYNHYYLPFENGMDYKGLVNFDLSWGVGIFTKMNIKISDQGFICVYDGKERMNHGDRPRNLQYEVIDIHNKKILIANLHGIWTGNGKGDTNERIEQSNRVTQFLNKFDTEKILCGDFNIVPHSESMKILERNMINLITKFNIDSTRSSLYKKDIKHADYILVSPNIRILNFQTLDQTVSDHLPLLMEFE